MGITEPDRMTVESFQNLWDREKIWKDMTWMGCEIWKNPCDMWLYQEAIFSVKPTLIVEFGSAKGGSALFFAHMMDVMDVDGKVVSVDIRDEDRPSHPRLKFLTGDSVSDRVVSAVKAEAARSSGPVMIVEDSSHNDDHVFKELRTYCDLVSVGSYFVVEDMGYERANSDLRRAVNEFIRIDGRFEVDQSKSKFIVTLASDGWLRRVR